MELNEAMSNALRPLGAQISERVITLASGRGIAWGPPSDATASHPAVALAARAARAAAEHANERTRIAADPRLSDDAKREDSEALDRKFLQRIEDEAREAEQFAERVEADYSRTLNPPALDPTDAVGALNDRECRDYIRGLTAAETLRLIADGSGRVVDAILRSPLPMPDVLIQAARQHRASTLSNSDQFRSLSRGKEYADWSRQVAQQSRLAVRGIASQSAAIRFDNGM